MRTRLMIATATAAALLAGAASAQLAPNNGPTGSNFSQNQQPPAPDTAVNPPASSDQLPAGVATGNAAVNPPTPSGQAGVGDATAPSAGASTSGSLNSSDAATVAPAAGATTQRAPAASAGTDVVASSPIPDTPQNRAKYGQPLSRAGRASKASGD